MYIDYQFLEVGILFKHYVARPFFYGLGFNYGFIVSNATYCYMGTNTYYSYYDLNEPPFSFDVDLGLSFEMVPKSEIQFYLQYHQDLNNVFPYYYFIEWTHLADITLNLGLVTKI